MNLVLLILQLAIPGMGVYFLVAKNLKFFDWFVQTFVWGLILNLGMLLTMSLIDFYSIKKWLAGSIVLSIISLIITIRRFKNEKISIKNLSRLNVRALTKGLVLALVAGSLYHQTSEFVIHYGMDSSGYLVQGAHYLKTGSLYLENAAFQLYKADFPSAEFVSSSFDGSTQISGKQEMHFPPLWKMTLAIPLYWGGLGFAVYTCLLMGILTVLIFGRWAAFEFKSDRIGWLGATLCLFTPVFIQYMKITMSEPEMYLFLLFGLYILQLSLREVSNWYAVVGGLALAATILVKADALMLLPTAPILPILLASSETKERQEVIKRFAISFFSWSVIFYSIVNKYCWNYMSASYTPGYMRGVYALTIIYLVVFCLFTFNKRGVAIFDWCLQKIPSQLSPPITNFFFVLLFTLIFIRTPTLLEWVNIRFPSPPFNVKEFFFPVEVIFKFVGLPLLMTGFFGLWLIFSNSRYRVMGWVSFFFFIGIMSLISAAHSPYPSWASRRYLNSFVPLMIISSLYLYDLMLISNKRIFERLAKLLIYVTLISMTILNFLLIDQFLMFPGTVAKINAFGNKFPKNSTYIIDKNHPLPQGLQLSTKYYYDVDALALPLDSVTTIELTSFIKKKIAEGKIPLVTALPEKIAQLKENFTITEFFNFDLNYFEAKNVIVYQIVPR